MVGQNGVSVTSGAGGRSGFTLHATWITGQAGQAVRGQVVGRSTPPNTLVVEVLLAGGTTCVAGALEQVGAGGAGSAGRRVGAGGAAGGAIYAGGRRCVELLVGAAAWW